MSKSLVTGGAGFIGAEVTKLLAGRGHHVTVFDLHPNEERLEGAKVELAQGDLGDASAVDQIVRQAKPDVIYHFGGMLSVPSEADHVASFRANALGTFNVLEAARKFGLPRVIFSSTMATFGMDIEGRVIDDSTLQRPNLFYGATKVFSEHMGLWFKRKHGLDFRGLRYPGIVGPGVTTPGVAQYNSWMIDAAIKGKPFTVWVRPDTRHAILYYRDAANAVLQLVDAPIRDLKRSVYVVAGTQPSPSAGELLDEVKRQIPEAVIRFEVDEEKQGVMDDLERPIDDGNALREWGWHPAFGLAEMVSDMRRWHETGKQRDGEQRSRSSSRGSSSDV